ncbi:MAG: DUF6607 family protein [Bacteroidota bacterium]|nr:DUF6607 family protein [Bacteroidota bacterium]
MYSLKLLLIMMSFGAFAQTKKEKDLASIKAICGCFEVNFNFAETFSYSKDSIYQPSENKYDKALEWVQLVDSSEDFVSMQHLLIVGDILNPYVIKHWRQDWMYENTDSFPYAVDNTWLYRSNKASEVKGQWTQRVFQVDDSPRYEGSATWVHVDGRSFWSSNADAPLPRREITKRQDYNVTLRRNHHEIFDWGWSHEQDNDKLVREADKKDVILAQEKGYNTYRKVENERCIAAQVFWEDNKEMWALVRKQWNTIFSMRQNIQLKDKVEGKRLFEYLFALKSNAKQEEISTIITSFLF